MLSNIGGNKISISRQINILTSVVTWSRALHYMIGSPDCGRLFPAYSADRVSFAAGLAAVKRCVQMLIRELFSENVKQRVLVRF